MIGRTYEGRAVADAVHLYSPSLTPAERKAMQHRRNESRDYDQSFVMAHQLLAALDEWADELAADEFIQSEIGSRKSEAKSKFTTTLGRWAIAACVLVAIVAGLQWSGENSMPQNDILRYVTRIGEQKTIELSDGSVITLNTASQVLVDMTDNMRRVVMDRGEAWFNVARDPLRPFTVELEGRSISVLGTEFSVRRSAEGFSLALLDGVVAIHRQGQEPEVDAPYLKTEEGTTLEIDASVQRRISAGTVVFFDALKQQFSAILDPQIQQRQSWRKGLLSFRGEPLVRVVEELNRYSAKPIQLEGSGLEGLKVFATFKIGQMALVMQGLENSVPVKVVPYVDRIVIVKRD